ncbi:MAG: HAD family hydrolase [Candidatus Obscuribacterales bacterium]|nr:HAD family hydrolase [Candidatus Obscuribacterales bacterium]
MDHASGRLESDSESIPRPSLPGSLKGPRAKGGRLRSVTLNRRSKMDVESVVLDLTAMRVGILPVRSGALGAIIVPVGNLLMERDTYTLTTSPALEESRGVLQREAAVLLGGGLEGLSRGAGQSLTDLGKFASDFSKAPITTTGEYLRNHWSEAAVAGAIAFVAPRKHFHMLLLAASGRGLAMSTFDGIVGAADTSQPLAQVRERFAASIAGESRSLINALPMTIAGGVGGRSLANATFGKNLGAVDLATGKVSWGEVKNNLWTMRDQVLPPAVRLAVVDLDGTLMSTSRHLSLGIENGNKVLAAATGLSEETVSGLMAEQFGKLKSFTNPWTVEMALAERLNVGKPGSMTYEHFRTHVSDPYWKVFDNTVTQNLKLYEGVHSTLGALRQKGVPVILWSNSPASAVIPRIRPHGIDTQISRAVMLENAKPPSGLAPELLQHGAERLASFMGRENSAFTTLSRDLAKPAPSFLNDVMKESNLRPSQVMVIGDSLQSDMGLAQQAGARGLWARWAEVDARYDALLNKVTKGQFPPAPSTGVPYEAELFRFSDSLKHLRAPRDISGLLRNNLGAPHWLTPLESYGLAFRPARLDDVKR